MASKFDEDTLQHNIRVNVWPRRQSENVYNEVYKFTTFRQLTNANNWIGNSQESVNNSTTVTFQYPINYSDSNFMLIPTFLMDELITEIFKVYRHKYSISENWFDNVNPFIAENERLFLRDPVFAQRVIIDNPNSRIFFIGDIHSSLHSLIDILKNLKASDVFVNDISFEMHGNCYIFFLGDLVDRGPYSVEVISLAFLLKLYNQENVFIINGNHEDRPMYSKKNPDGNPNNAAGYSDEIYYQFGVNFQSGEYEKLHQLMYALPSVIYLDFAGKKYHLSHGAIPLDEEEIKLIGIFLTSSKEFLLIKDEDSLHPLKWGDFRVNEGVSTSDYGRHQFGSDLITKYTTNLGIECLITGHQDLEAFMILPIEALSFEEVEVPNDLSLSVFALDEDILENKSTKSDDGYNSSEVIIEKRLKEQISFNDNIFMHCNHSGIECTPVYYKRMGTYSIPVKYDLFKRAGNSEVFDFDPENILALTTSTATIAKNISTNTYLELVAKNKSQLSAYRSSKPYPALITPKPYRPSIGRNKSFYELSGLN